MSDFKEKLEKIIHISIIIAILIGFLTIFIGILIFASENFVRKEYRYEFNNISCNFSRCSSYSCDLFYCDDGNEYLAVQNIKKYEVKNEIQNK